MPKGAADDWLETNRNRLHQTQGAPMQRPPEIAADMGGFLALCLCSPVVTAEAMWNRFPAPIR
jgi:hypothetical protein